jgi:hypothetical protein
MDSHMKLLNDEPGGSSERGSDDDQFASQPEEQGSEEQPPGEAALPVQPTKKTAKNFTVKEDNLLVYAWLETTMDAVQETEHFGHTYWQRIHDYFHVHKDFESDCDVNSLMCRWDIIRETVTRFCPCYAQIQNVWESYITEQDKV